MLSSPDEATASGGDRFEQLLHYVRIDLSNESEYEGLSDSTAKIEAEHGSSVDASRVVYLATAPSLFDDAVLGLHHSGLIPPLEHKERLRVVVKNRSGMTWRLLNNSTRRSLAGCTKIRFTVSTII